MSSDKEAAAEQIIIVRRRGHDEEEGHHGGVWKIAYADFMTAMMAFFLVMWLINAANTETKASVASYFNPIRLMDNVSRKKGLLDLDEKANATDRAKQAKRDSSERPRLEPDRSRGQAKQADDMAAQVGKDGAIDAAAEQRHRLALSTDNAAPALRREESQALSGSASESGPAFRDPFNPLASGRPQPNPSVAFNNAEAPTLAPKAAMVADEPAPGSIAKTDLTEVAERLRRDVTDAVRQIGASGGPGIDVTIEGDAVVLSLTDTSTFGMFAVGSADPNVDLAGLIQSLAPVLTANAQRIILRGHTDSRPFKSDKFNNNWRLAMARAETAYTLLLRSGIDDARFERIEAYADRKPKLTQDPEAAANRRIEILLRRGAMQ